MTPSKSLTAAIAAAAMVSVIGLAYAQTSNDSTQVRPGQTANPTGTMATQPAATPGTVQGTTPSNTPMAGDTSSTTSPSSSSTNSNTGANMGNNTGSSAGMNAGSNASTPNDPNAVVTEREARADRN